jgi:inosose dehydratase
MRIGASTYSLRKAIDAGTFDLPGAFDWLAAQGADHVEIVPVAGLALDETPEVADALAARARGLGLDISCYTFGASFIDRTPEAFATELQRVKTHVDLAARLGTRLVRHDVASRPAPDATDEQFARDLPVLVDACGQIADYARPLGITTMIENHGFHVQGGDRVLQIHHAVARDNFRLLVDTGNFYPVEFEHTLDAIARCAPFAGMAHVKDHHIRTAPPPDLEGWRDRGRGIFTQPAIAAEGDLDIPTAIRSLHAAGYDGYLSLEYEGPEEACFANRRGLDNLRAILQAL